MYSQYQIFLLFFIIGIIIGLLFDIFKSLRKTFKTPDIITILEDIIYLLIIGFLITLGVFKLNNGEIRMFLFLAIFLGITVYSLTISEFCVIIFTVITNVFKNIIFFPIFLFKKINFFIKKKEN